jgi:hypothetical protein
MKSTDNGATWTFLTTIYNSASNKLVYNKISITSKGTRVYWIGAYFGTLYMGSFEVGAAVPNPVFSNSSLSSYSEFTSVDLVYSSVGDRFHGVVSYRNGTQWGLGYVGFNENHFAISQHQLDSIAWNDFPWNQAAITVNSSGFPIIMHYTPNNNTLYLFRSTLSNPDTTGHWVAASVMQIFPPSSVTDGMAMCRNPFNGWLYLSYTENASLKVIYSPDNGVTWTSGGAGITYTGSTLYGVSNTVDSLGRLNVIYREYNGSIANIYSVIYGVDSITTWSAPKLIKSSSSNGVQVPQMPHNPTSASNPVTYTYLHANVNDWTTYYETVNQAPNAPIPQYPLYGVNYNSSTVQMGWVHQDPDGNPQSAWRAQISRNSAFTDVILDTGKVLNSNQSWEFYGIPDGVYYYRIQTWDSFDVMGPYNVVGDGQSFRIDTVLPSATGVSVPQYLPLASGTFRVWAYGVADNASGINRVQFPTCNVTVSGGATWIWFDGIKNGATNDWYCDIPLSSFANAEGSYYTDPYVYDNAGNLFNPGRIYTWIDRTKPTAPAQTNGILYAASNGVSWSAFNDGPATSGLLLTTLYLQKWNGSTWVNEPTFPKSVTGLTYSFTGLTPGTQYRWGVTYTDNAANVSTLNYTTFTTNSYAISTITNLASSGSIMNQKPRVRFTVTDANNATLTDFQIQISTVNTFASTIIDTKPSVSVIGWSGQSAGSGSTVWYTPQVNIGVGTLYIRVRAFDGIEWGTWSTTISVTVKAVSWPTTVSAADTAVSKRTVDSIRVEVNNVRQARGLAAAVWTDSVVNDWNNASPTQVKATHVIELRQAIVDIYSALGIVSPTWTDNILSSSVARKGTHWIDLRNAIIAV